jgi:hypothetical protein
VAAEQARAAQEARDAQLRLVAARLGEAVPVFTSAADATAELLDELRHWDGLAVKNGYTIPRDAPATARSPTSVLAATARHGDRVDRRRGASGLAWCRRCRGGGLRPAVLVGSAGHPQVAALGAWTASSDELGAVDGGYRAVKMATSVHQCPSVRARWCGLLFTQGCGGDVRAHQHGQPGRRSSTAGRMSTR